MMKKLLACFALFMSVFLYADDYGDGCETDCEEDREDFCEDPCRGCGRCLFVGAEFLYMKPCVEQDECAFVADKFEADCPDGEYHGSFKSWDFDWRPGVRAFAGLCDLFCCLDLWASYTYLNFTSSKGFKRPEEDSAALFCPIFASQPLFNCDFDHLHTHNRIRFQELDILLSKPCCIPCCHTVIPFAGLDCVIFDQHARAYGKGSTCCKGRKGYCYKEASTSSRVKQKSHFSGAGIKMGLTYLYDCCECLRLYSKFSGSLLYGHEHDHLRQSVKSRDENDLRKNEESKKDCEHISRLRTRGSSCLFTPGISLGVGLQYSGYVNNCCNPCGCPWPITIYLGYEFNEWFNLWQFRKRDVADCGTTSPSRGSIGFHGAHAGFLLTF
jgi:hypothetical protein